MFKRHAAEIIADILKFVIAGLLVAFILFPFIVSKVDTSGLSYRGVVCIPEPCREVWSQKWQK